MAGMSFADVFAVLSEGQQAGLTAWVINGADAQDLPSGDVAFAAKVYATLKGEALEGAQEIIRASFASSSLEGDPDVPEAASAGKGKGKGARKARKTSASSGDKTPATSANAPITLPSVRIDTALLWHSSNRNHAHWSGTVAGVKVTDAPYTFAKGAYADRYVPKTAKIVLTMAFAKQLLECAGDAGKIDALDAKVAKHLGARNARVFVGQRVNREWLEAALEDIEAARKG